MRAVDAAVSSTKHITAPEATACTGSASKAAAMARVCSLIRVCSALAESTAFSTRSAAAPDLSAM